MVVMTLHWMQDAGVEVVGKSLAVCGQTQDEKGVLYGLVPPDQVVMAEMRWEGGLLVVRVLKPVESGGESVAAAGVLDECEVSRLEAMGLEELQALAAERKVKWNKRWSARSAAEALSGRK